MEECISILNALSILKDVNIILTYPNSDFERDKIIHKIKLFALKKIFPLFIVTENCQDISFRNFKELFFKVFNIYEA